MRRIRLIPTAVVAATSALVTAGLMLPPAQASPVGVGAAAGVTHYAGTRGVARLLPRSVRPAAGDPARAFPKGARRLSSGRVSATEAIPAARTASGAAAASA